MTLEQSVTVPHHKEPTPLRGLLSRLRRRTTSEPAADEGWVHHDSEDGTGFSGWLYHYADGAMAAEDGTVYEFSHSGAVVDTKPEPGPEPEHEPEPEPAAEDEDEDEDQDQDEDEDEQEDDSSHHLDTARTAAFSDAVFAIVITLLILDIKPPQLAPGQTLADALLAMWPRYIALLSSWAIIGLMWIHHHRVFRYLDHADHMLLKLNLLLMLGVSLVPLSTALLASYPDEQTSAVIYTSVVAVDAVLFSLIWGHARRGHRLLRADIDRSEARAIDRQYRIGAAAFIALVGVSFFSVRISILGTIVLSLFFALPLRTLKHTTLRHRRGAAASA